MLVVTALVPTPADAKWHEQSEAIMGTRVHIEFFSQEAELAQELITTVMKDMHRIDNLYSPYKETSDLSLLNAKAVNDWTVVSDEMLLLLQKSQQVSELSNGAFDITYASVGRYYDYRRGVRPDDSTIENAVKAIDYRYIELDVAANKVRFRHPRVYIDLGGIAKGYAVDRAIDILLSQGIEHASVSAGGDSRIIGDRRGKPWVVGVQDPRDEEKMSAILPLVDTAVSTSGDYERYFEEEGVRFHHILDPSTGKSATGSWSVTILGPEATLTDALSTSVFVLGPDKGLELINRLPGIDAILIDPQGRLRFSAELDQLSH